MTKPYLRQIARAIAMLAAFASFSFAVPLQAQGDLLVAPTRVILDGRRGTEVILSNIGSEEATYRIGLELRRMLPSGQLADVALTDANQEEKAALDMIRYAPRRITLPPGQPQAVRISARPGADLPDGEYRVHMAFRAIPKPRPVVSNPAETSEVKGVSIKLIPIYGVTIPIIVRHGRVEAQVALSNPRIEHDDKGPQLVIDMARHGDSSTYGELRVTRPGLKDPLVLVRGVAIYPEIDKRVLRLMVNDQQAAMLKGPVRIEYREMPEAGGGLIAALDGVIG